MSANPYYDIIEDEVVKLLEQDLFPPEPMNLDLEPEQFQALLGAGLRIHGTADTLPLTATRVRLSIAGYKIDVRSEATPHVWPQQ